MNSSDRIGRSDGISRSDLADSGQAFEKRKKVGKKIDQTIESLRESKPIGSGSQRDNPGTVRPKRGVRELKALFESTEDESLTKPAKKATRLARPQHRALHESPKAMLPPRSSREQQSLSGPSHRSGPTSQQVNFPEEGAVESEGVKFKARAQLYRILNEIKGSEDEFQGKLVWTAKYIDGLLVDCRKAGMAERGNVNIQKLIEFRKLIGGILEASVLFGHELNAGPTESLIDSYIAEEAGIPQDTNIADSARVVENLGAFGRENFENLVSLSKTYKDRYEGINRVVQETERKIKRVRVGHGFAKGAIAVVQRLPKHELFMRELERQLSKYGSSHQAAPLHVKTMIEGHLADMNREKVGAVEENDYRQFVENPTIPLATKTDLFIKMVQAKEYGPSLGAPMRVKEEAGQFLKTVCDPDRVHSQKVRYATYKQIYSAVKSELKRVNSQISVSEEEIEKQKQRLLAVLSRLNEDVIIVRMYDNEPINNEKRIELRNKIESAISIYR